MSQTTDTNIISSINAVEGFDPKKGRENHMIPRSTVGRIRQK